MKRLHILILNTFIRIPASTIFALILLGFDLFWPETGHTEVTITIPMSTYSIFEEANYLPTLSDLLDPTMAIATCSGTISSCPQGTTASCGCENGSKCHCTGTGCSEKCSCTSYSSSDNKPYTTTCSWVLNTSGKFDCQCTTAAGSRGVIGFESPGPG